MPGIRFVADMVPRSLAPRKSVPVRKDIESLERYWSIRGSIQDHSEKAPDYSKKYERPSYHNEYRL